MYTQTTSRCNSHLEVVWVYSTFQQKQHIFKGKELKIIINDEVKKYDYSCVISIIASRECPDAFNSVR